MFGNEVKLDALQRGTRILGGELATAKRRLLNAWSEALAGRGWEELELPSVESKSIYLDKAGPEVLGQMWTFEDKGGREVCLRPEGTATCQLLARQHKYSWDSKVFYTARCWRYERPQEGRYREFTQFGVEILLPRQDYTEELISLVGELLDLSGLPRDQWQMNDGVSRGLAYYKDGKGFEVEIPILGAQKQVVGGGPYDEGVGFAIGTDRVLVALQKLDLLGGIVSPASRV